LRASFTVTDTDQPLVRGAARKRERYELQIYRMNDPLAEYRVGRATIGVDFGYGFSRFTEVRVGYEIGDLDAKLRLGTPEFASVSGRTGNFRFSLLMDHADDPIIPRRGYKFGHAVPICGYEPRRDGKFSRDECSPQLLSASVEPVRSSSLGGRKHVWI